MSIDTTRAANLQRAGITARRGGRVMIAYRFSGDLRIRVTLHDKPGGSVDYRCYIAPRGMGSVLGATVFVGLPPYLPRAVDAPETIDAVARASLAFAADEGWPVDTYAASNEAGYLVTRKEVRR